MPVRHPEASTASGRVRGRLRDVAAEPGPARVAEYLGIPYARPPVGKLRFAAPVPPEPWHGTREATGFGPASPQPGVTSTESADWLTVNVWTPDPGAGGLPVFVWVHGGAYRNGSSSQPAYDGSLLATTGLMVVTCNYRLGVEGFAQIEGAVANRGLLDVQAVLGWVAQNARAFGGDPGNVTLAGESAGAGVVASLLAMDSAHGLLRRAITQSTPGTFFTTELAGDIAAAIAEAAGLLPSAGAFASAEPGRLVAAACAVETKLATRRRWGAVTQTVTLFSPVVDGEVLPRTPWRAMRAGAAREIDVLTGHTRDEYRLIMLLNGMLGKVTDADADLAVRSLGAPDYRAAFPDAPAEKRYELVLSDWLLRIPSLRIAQAHSGLSHLYEVTYPAPGSGGVLGACHGLDVGLIFGSWTEGFGTMMAGPRPPAALLALGDLMRAEWAAFAATGNPGWPAWQPAGQHTRIYADPSAVTAYPEQASMRMWENHQFDPLPLLD